MNTVYGLNEASADGLTLIGADNGTADSARVRRGAAALTSDSGISGF